MTTAALRTFTTSLRNNSKTNKIMAPIPIALCGKSSTMAQSFSQSMLPEFESKTIPYY